MSLQFGDLLIQGFRSFVGVQHINLGQGEGLTYITGKNLVEPALGANGVGKSSLFEALYWVLFGKTSRNLRAGDVANWTEKEQCHVELSFRTDQHYELTRTWNPNTLRLNDEEVAQDRVQAALGMSEEAFLHTVFHAQFVPQFADRSPATQLEVFSEVLSLQVWEQASDLASDKARKQKDNAHAMEIAVAGARAKLQALADRMEEQQDSEVAWWRAHLPKLRATAEQIQDLALVVENLRDVAALVPGVPKSLLKKIEDAEKEASEAHTVLATDAAALKEICTKQDELKQGKKIEEAEECPTCLQKVNRRVTAKLREELAHKLWEARKHLEQTVQLMQQSYDKKKKVMQDLYEEKREVRRALDAEVAKANNELFRVKEKHKEARMTFDSLLNARCPFDTTNLEVEEREAQQKLDLLLEQASETQLMQAACEFWSKGFREIRLSLVQDALAQFEVSTNSALAALGLQEWTIEYGVEADTKGGKVSRGFKIFVHSPYNKDPVPFIAWSGGESQRLRIAITVGLSDLIQDFLGLHSNLEIFDEPTAWLSGEGINDLLQMLDARGRERKGNIMLADHKALDSALAQRIVTVEKDEEGSKIGL